MNTLVVTLPENTNPVSGGAIAGDTCTTLNG